MFSWFFFSIASVVLFGIAIALYKLPSAKKESKTATTLWLLVFNFLFALAVFYESISGFDLTIILFGAAWGLGFTLIVPLQMYALEHVDTNVLFPVITTFSLIISVTLGLLFFTETISLIQVAGISLAAVAIYLFLYKGVKFQYSTHLIIIGLGILTLSVFGKIIIKFAADAVSIEPLQISQYFFAAIFALILSFIFNRSDRKRIVSAGVVKSGFIISIPSFLGGWSLLTALTMGPFTLITSLHSMYIFVTALVGYFLFKETLTKKKVLLILFAIFAIFLIRMG